MPSQIQVERLVTLRSGPSRRELRSVRPLQLLGGDGPLTRRPLVATSASSLAAQRILASLDALDAPVRPPRAPLPIGLATLPLASATSVQPEKVGEHTRLLLEANAPPMRSSVDVGTHE